MDGTSQLQIPSAPGATKSVVKFYCAQYLLHLALHACKTLGEAGIASACLFCWLALIAALAVPGVFIPSKWGHLPCSCVGCRSFLSLGSSLLQHYRQLESRGVRREGVLCLCRFCAALFACRNSPMLGCLMTNGKETCFLLIKAKLEAYPKDGPEQSGAKGGKALVTC